MYLEEKLQYYILELEISHGGIYEVRSDLHSVIHSHSHAVIPFGLTGAAIRPVFHMGSTMLGPIPIWDISDKFGDTTLLVLNMDSRIRCQTAPLVATIRIP